METRGNRKMYYIYGVGGHVTECIAVLEQHGGINHYGLNEYCDWDRIYYIDTHKYINWCDKDTDMSDMVIAYGYELFINEEENENSPIQIPGISEKQSKSINAAIKISRIREAEKLSYGDIALPDRMSHILTKFGTSIMVWNLFANQNYGGLLRFETAEAAELFLSNHRDLVEDYLETF